MRLDTGKLLLFQLFIPVEFADAEPTHPHAVSPTRENSLSDLLRFVQQEIEEELLEIWRWDHKRKRRQAQICSDAQYLRCFNCASCADSCPYFLLRYFRRDPHFRRTACSACLRLPPHCFYYCCYSHQNQTCFRAFRSLWICTDCFVFVASDAASFLRSNSIRVLSV